MNFSERDLRRFWSRVRKTDTCWLWTGYISPIGYAPFMFNAKAGSAHRFSFMLHKGPIPEGLDIDHICRVRHCVNPAHLRAVTHRENVLSGNTTPAKHAAQTHCLRGHEFTAENTYVNTRGERQCRACIKLRDRAYKAKTQNGQLELLPKSTRSAHYLTRREAELINV